jgi:hypothetical protein
VQIGSLAGTAASLPAALLRSRRIRITGSGVGSVSAHQGRTRAVIVPD